MYQSKRDTLENELNNAIEKGARFIINSLQDDVYWRSFRSSQGESDVWVTAYILNEIGDLLPDNFFLKVQHSIYNSRNNDGGWAYSKKYISDADSTATVCLALLDSEIDFLGKERFKIKSFLLDHLVNWYSGFQTFKLQPLQSITKLHREQLQGWTLPHVDVSANVTMALLKLSDDLLDECLTLFKSLEERNQSNSLIEAYWWATDYYSTYYIFKMAESLSINISKTSFYKHIFIIKDEIKREKLWESFFSKRICNYTSSYAIRCLCYQEEKDMSILDSVYSLISRQKTNGSWNSEPILAIPSPHYKSKYDVKDWRIDLPGFPNVLSDNRKVLVTAVVVKTLIEVSKTFNIPVKKQFYE